MKFSIIIPAYNVSEFIGQAVNGVLSQTFNNYEVILVDDGSTDGKTAQLIDQLAEQDEKISVIHQLNTGLSGARNTGIRVARGEYLIFLDGDDFWDDHNFLSSLDSLIKEVEKPDCVITSYYYYYGEGKKSKIEFRGVTNGELIENKEVMVTSGLILAPAWNKVIRRDFFDDSLFFPEKLYYEDAIWCGELLKKVQKVVYSDSPAIMYRQNREGSITHEVTKEKVRHSLKGLAIGMQNIDYYQDKTQYALMLYYCQSYISILPFVQPYLKDDFIMNLLGQYRNLLKYSTHLSNKTFAATGLLARLFGIRASSWLLHKALPLYKRNR